MKQLVVGIRLHARAVNGFMPTNFDQFASTLPVTTNFSGTALLLPNGNALSNFEFINPGLVNDTTPDKLIFREKNLRRTPEGNWTRIYGLADGTVVKKISPHGNFEDWEKERSVQP